MKKVPYASAVGRLMYAIVCTRPDIAHAVGVVSRFISGKSTGQLLNGSSGILRQSVCVLVMASLCFLGTQMQIWLVMLILETRVLDNFFSGSCVMAV